jgi:hypothetical protein
MKYEVATIVSVLLGALLIGAVCVQTRSARQRTQVLRARLSTESFDQLSRRFWDCEPQRPGEPYKRDALYCAEVTKALDGRQIPGLQVVKIFPPTMMIPELARTHFAPKMISPKITLATPQDLVSPPTYPISSARPVSAAL